MSTAMYASLGRQLKDSMQQALEKEQIAGISLVLTDGGGELLRVNAGWSDRGGRAPMTADTITGIASVSKTVTAAAVMQLHERGILDINAPLTSVIPEFSVKTRSTPAPPIRIKDLMTHRSGLPRDWLNHFYTYEREPFEEIVGRLRDEYACRPAGMFYSYSNLGVTLLGVAVERAAGMAFEQYVTKNILTPLGMTSSSYRRQYSLCGRYAQAYHGLRLRPEIPPRDLPAGGLYSSAADLAAFLRAHLSGERLLRRSTVEQMLEPQEEDAPLNFHKKMGLIWHLDRPALAYAGRVAHHGGALLYYRSDVCMLPDHGLGVAVLSNSDTAGGAVLRLAEEALQGALAIREGIQPQKAAPRTFVCEPPLIQTPLDGDYATSLGHMRFSAGDPAWCIWNGKKTPLTAARDGSSIMEPDGAALGRTIALRSCRDTRTGAEILLFNGWPDGEKFVPEPVLEAWRDRQGLYRACDRMPEERLTDIVHSIRILVRRGLLLAEFIGPGWRYRRILRQEGDREAVRMGWGQEEQGTIHVRDTEDGEALEFMGIRFAKRTKDDDPYITGRDAV